MAFPNAPTEGGGDKIHFLTSDANGARGWFSVYNALTTTGSSPIGFAAIATHIEGDPVAEPGGLPTGSVPLVMAGGDDGTNAKPLQLDGSGSLKAVLQAGTAAIGKLAANDAVDIGDVTINNAVGSGVYVRPGTAATWDVSDRAARDLGKVDVAAFDVALPAGGNLIGQVDINSITPDVMLGSDFSAVFGTAPVVDGSNHLQVDIAADSVGIGGGVQYDVDDPLGATPTGTLALAKRDDALSALTPIEADAVELRVDGQGALWTRDSVLGAALSGSELQVDIVGSLPAGTNNIGDVDVATVPAPLNVVGGGTQATALRVTIATDTTGVLSVDDNGSSLTVDNAGTFAVQVNGAALTALQLIDDPVFADDAPFSLASSKVMMAGAIRDDTLTTLGAAEGDAVPLRVNSQGALHVVGGGGGVQYQEDAVHSSGDTGTMALAVREDAMSPLAADGDYIPLTVNSDGALYTRVTGVTPGTGSSDLGKAEDASHASGHVGVMALSVRKDTPVALADTNQDYQPFITDGNGALWTHDNVLEAALSGSELQVDVVAALPAGDNNIGNVDVVTVPAPLNITGGGTESAALRVTIANDSTGVISVDDGDGSLTVDNAALTELAAAINSNQLDVNIAASGATVTVDLGANNDVVVEGDVAHDSPDSGGGGPVKIGGRAQEPTAAPDEVADDDRVDALWDRNGRLGVWAGSDYKYAAVNVSSSGDNTIIAATAGKRIAVWAWDLVSDGTVDARWENGAGGSAFTGQYPFQAREGMVAAGGGLVPKFVGTANTLLNLELSAAINVHGSVAYTLIDD